MPAGNVLANEGQRVSSIYLVESGLVIIERRGGRRNVVLGLRARGDVLGAPCAVHGTTHVATLTAATEVRALPVPVNTFNESRRDPAVAEWLIGRLAADVAASIEWCVNLTARAGDERMQALLVELFWHASDQRADGGRRLRVHERVEDLASGIGVSRERASRLLSALMAKGVVTRDASGWFVAPPGSPIHGRLARLESRRNVTRRPARDHAPV
jgi:CRP-like cAMP-binding protein